MTYLIRVPGVFDNAASLPEYLADPLLINGSLALFEPGHPANRFTGVPVNGGYFPNIAEAKARQLLGNQAADVRFPFDMETGGEAYTLRSSLGGLFMRYRAPGTGRSRVRFPRAIVDYILANPTHTYATAIWWRVVDTWTQGGRLTEMTDANNSRTSPNPWMAGYQPATTQFNPADYSAVRSAVPTITGERTAALIHAVSRICGMDIGGDVTNYLPSSGAQRLTVYRVYLEDLTVSGRSNATLLTLSNDLHNKEVKTAGGRYYADVHPTVA